MGNYCTFCLEVPLMIYNFQKSICPRSLLQRFQGYLQWKIIDSLGNLFFPFFLSGVNQLSFTEGTAEEYYL